jgi:hypothetical protein
MYNFYYNIFYNEFDNGTPMHSERMLIKSNTSLFPDNIKMLIRERLGKPKIEIDLSTIQQIDLDTFILLGGDKNALQLTAENGEYVPPVLAEKTIAQN